MTLAQTGLNDLRPFGLIARRVSPSRLELKSLNDPLVNPLRCRPALVGIRFLHVLLRRSRISSNVPSDDSCKRRSSLTAVTAGSHQIGHPVSMIFGSHFVLFSSDADADRAFLADVLGFANVDAGGGWLIFGLPPAEAAIHPADGPGSELYFMCDDLVAEMRTLAAKGVQCSEVEEARWGSETKIPLPGGGEVGLYQPRHPAMVERT